MTITTKAATANNPSGALIGYNNLLTASTTSDAERALVPNTYERFTPSSGAFTVKFQMDSDAAVDFIGIAAHNLSGQTLEISTAATIGGALTSVETVVFADNAPVMLVFDSRTIREVALVGTLTGNPEFGVIYAGAALQMPSNIYGGHSPITLSQKNVYRSTMSEGGQTLGKTIIRKGVSASYSWKLLDADWYRLTFQPFVLSAQTTPFFIKWRPDLYPDEVAFGETSSDITPTNSGGGLNYVAVGFSMTGHSDL